MIIQMATGHTKMDNRREQSVEDVKETMALIKKTDARMAMARGMIRVGNLTDEARHYVLETYGSAK